MSSKFTGKNILTPCQLLIFKKKKWKEKEQSQKSINSPLHTPCQDAGRGFLSPDLYSVKSALPLQEERQGAQQRLEEIRHTQ